MRDKRYKAAYCRAYNDFIADFCRKAPALRAMAVLPFDDVAVAVEEAESGGDKAWVSRRRDVLLWTSGAHRVEQVLADL